MRVIVPGYCTSKSAAMTAAQAGEVSAAEAESAFKNLIDAKACTFWGYPHAMLTVEAVVHGYRDFKGRVTQVLQTRPVNAPETEVYALVLAERARASGAKYCPK